MPSIMTHAQGLHLSPSGTRLASSYTSTPHDDSPLDEFATPLGRPNSNEQQASPPLVREVQFAELPSRRETMDGSWPIVHSSIEVSVPSQIFIRGAGGDYEPVYLMGEVILNLSEATNVREITAHLAGKAKIHYNDNASGSRTHSDSIPVLEHEWSFLPGDRRHMHTIKAGRHVFPFQMELDGNVPASLRTMGGNASITYKIRANAIRSAFSTNYSDARTFNIVRTFLSEALEYTQTLELENTWPGKVMYSIMIPHRAHAAGTEVPISVKFTPLTKGVEVKNIGTEIKEYTTLSTKSGPISSSRSVLNAKHEFRNGQAFDVSTSTSGSSRLARTATAPAAINTLGPRMSRSTGSLPALAAAHAARESSFGSVSAEAPPSSTPRSSLLSSSAPRTPPNGLAMTTSAVTTSTLAGSVLSTSPTQENEEEAVDLGAGDGEIDTTFKVMIPAWATPTHPIKPIQVSHKIKWCCMLSNLDGHTSELRCALPIHILAAACAEEARNATSNTHTLLFGTGSPEEPVVELPSYPEHVRDRVANASLDATTTAVAPLSAYTSPAGSPRLTPMVLPELSHESSVRFAEPFTSVSRVSSVDDSYFPAGTSFADTELLSSLGTAFGGSAASSSHGGSHAQTPNESRGPSRPNSRPTSRVNSRASSPEPRDREPGPSDSTATLASDSTARGGLFHLPLSMKPLTSFNAKGKGKALTPPDAGSPNLSPTFRRRNGRSSTSRPSSPPPAALPPPDPMSTVPDYDIASRGFLGGGVVPLTAQAGLPSYDEAERLERSRSETSLTDLARQIEHASLTDRLHSIVHPPHHHRGHAGLQMTASHH